MFIEIVYILICLFEIIDLFCLEVGRLCLNYKFVKGFNLNIKVCLLRNIWKKMVVG